MHERLILISTTDLASGRERQVERMLASVDRFCRANPVCEVRHLFLFQNAAGRSLPQVPQWVEADSCDTLIPLSEARNRLLAKIDFAKEGEGTVVAFPDDDAWFPDGSIDWMRRQVVDSPSVDMAFCRYAPEAAGPGPETASQKADLQQTLSHACSATMFLRAPLAARLGFFASDLGLGTKMKSGEDTDYAMRGWHLARETRVIDAALVGHAASDPAKKALYFAGALSAIARNRMLSAAAWRALLRKLAVGVVYVTQRRISAREVFSAFG